MFGLGPVRVLDDRDRADALELCLADPIANCYVLSRILDRGLKAWHLGAEVWGYFHSGRLTALCYVGGNLIPIGADDAALDAFAARARHRETTCSSIVGDAALAMGLWQRLQRYWRSPRAVRANQPLMATAGPPWVPPDPQVRPARPDEFNLVFPAAVAMYTEEVGISPIDGSGGYRRRVAELIAAGRSFVRIDAGKVVFKADVGCSGAGVCQIQGVWTAPEHRGQGIATAGMAAVLAQAGPAFGPMVSLYVNDFNKPARIAYERVGFRTVGALASVLF